MILISVSFIYILLLTVVFGVGFSKLFLKEEASIIATLFLGLFTTMLLGTIWAFFGRINLEFQLLFFCSGILILIWQFQQLKILLFRGYKHIKDLGLLVKILMLLTTFLIIMQCASAPYVLDNESYYIQTIAVLNEYGLVKGLGNLHIFLAQTSGWHIAQSVFNFSFAYDYFNDLSGFCLLITNIWALRKLDLYFKESKNFWNLVFGLFPVASIFFFQFISAPSTDIPIYCITFVMLATYIDSFKTLNNHVQTLFSLALFCAFIKVTSFVLFLFPILAFISQKNAKKQIPTISVILGVIVGFLFMAKNSVLSGYPLFPLLWIDFLNVDWKLPIELASSHTEMTKGYGFMLSAEGYHSSSFLELVKIWLQLPRLQGIFNVSAIIMTVVFPLIIMKWTSQIPLNQRDRKTAQIIYLIFVAQLVLLLLTSPQYRFYFNMLWVLACMALGILFFHQKYLVKIGMSLMIVLPMIPLIGLLNTKSLSNNTFSESLSQFSLQYIMKPHHNSKFNTSCITYKEGNFIFNHPKDISFHYGTGACPFPALNLQQYNYFKYDLHIIPQQRTDNLKDGFYSKHSVHD